MTANAGGRTLPSYERRLVRAGIARGTALFAACLVAVMPLLVLTSLDRSLPALAVVVAVPADSADNGVERLRAELRGHPLTRELAHADAARTAELWRTLSAEGAPPTLIEAELWPAAAVDVAALRRRLEEIAPAAVLQVRTRPRAEPRTAFALAAGAALSGVAAVWRVRRAVRRVLDAERPTIGLVRRFGATGAWIETQFARPLERRVRRGALAGAGAGALIGAGATATLDPGLFQPWTGAASVVVLATAVAFTLTVAGFVRIATVAARRGVARAGDPL